MFFFFSSRRRHTRLQGDWSSDVCSSDLPHSVPGCPSLLELVPDCFRVLNRQQRSPITCRCAQRSLDLAAQFARLQPQVKGQSESMFRARSNCVRQHIPHRCHKQWFPPGPLGLPTIRDRENMLDQRAVKKWFSHLQTASHSEAVCVTQQYVAEIV